MGTPRYFLILLCYVTSEYGLDIVYLSCRIIQWRVIKVRIADRNFVRLIIAVSKLSTPLALRTPEIQ